MNIDDLTIGQMKEIKKFLDTPVTDTSDSHPYMGRRVIVRTYASGVHLCTLKSYNRVTRDAILVNTQRIHRWEGAFTLSKVATVGITGGRVSCIVNEMFVNQVIEIIPATEMAEMAIAAIGVHNE